MLSRYPLARPDLAHCRPAALFFWIAQVVVGSIVMLVYWMRDEHHEIDDPILAAVLALGISMVGGLLGGVGFLATLSQFQIANRARRPLWVCSACAGGTSVMLI